MIKFLKGFLIGIGKIIPGVSGSMLAAIMGVYEKSLDCICNFKENKKESIKYLSPIALGILTSIILFSKIISICLSKYYIVTMLFFIGLVLGGLPYITNKVNKKDYYITIISFLVFFIISITNINNNYIPKNNIIDILVYLLSGLLEGIGTVLPGVSSTALLMIVGTYNIIIYSVGNITNIKILIPFILGTIISIIILIKVVDKILKNKQNKLYSFVLGVLLSSIVLLIIKTFQTKVTIPNLVVGIIFMIIGIIITNLFKEK